MIQIVTATGARPKAWSLCERWMSAQDYQGPVRWLVVDDGPDPQPVTFKREGWDVVLIRPAPFWKPGENTQARNLAKGVGACDPAHLVVFIEDDDHYAPGWLSKVVEESARAEVVGEMRARYYNVASRVARQLQNMGHASLCSTAIRGPALQTFLTVCRTASRFIDIQLWRAHRSKHLFGGNLVTGIKGLPGREGIGMGHSVGFAGVEDRAGNLLRQWIGSDAEAYNERS